MKLRFCASADLLSEMICAREGECQPFTPSHVEIVLPEGYLGARFDGGVAIRPVGYDANGLAHELFVDVALPDEAAAESYARGKVGTPYDWQAIIDFALPTDFDGKGELICSAFATLALDAGKLFAATLAVPAHAVSPRDLLFWLSGRL